MGLFRGGTHPGDGGSGTDVHSWRESRPSPAPTPCGSIPELGGGWQSRIWPRTQAQKWGNGVGLEGGGGGGSFGCQHTKKGKEQEGLKIKCFCSALLKIEKVALDSFPTKGLKVEQAPHRGM